MTNDEVTFASAEAARQAWVAAQAPANQAMADNVTKLFLCTLMLNDSIHHRGQMSVYLRISGGKVPSIYGPTADVRWEGADPTRSVAAASRK